MRPSQLLALLAGKGIVSERVTKKNHTTTRRLLNLAQLSFTQRELDANPELAAKVERLEAFFETMTTLANEKSNYKFSKRDFLLNSALRSIEAIEAPDDINS